MKLRESGYLRHQITNIIRSEIVQRRSLGSHCTKKNAPFSKKKKGGGKNLRADVDGRVSQKFVLN
jgi:hypothetical protein